MSSRRRPPASSRSFHWRAGTLGLTAAIAPHQADNFPGASLEGRGWEVEDDWVEDGIGRREEQRLGPPPHRAPLDIAQYVCDVVRHEADDEDQ